MAGLASDALRHTKHMFTDETAALAAPPWRIIVIADLHGVLTGNHWDALRGLLPAYRRISHVQVGNGQDTSFWKDQWIGDQPLSSQLPALHRHLLRGASVEEVVFPTCNTIPTKFEPAGGNRAASTGVHAVRCEPE